VRGGEEVWVLLSAGGGVVVVTRLTTAVNVLLSVSVCNTKKYCARPVLNHLDRVDMFRPGLFRVGRQKMSLVMPSMPTISTTTYESVDGLWERDILPKTTTDEASHLNKTTNYFVLGVDRIFFASAARLAVIKVSDNFGMELWQPDPHYLVKDVGEHESFR
jgi:hypothetical protein